MSISLDNPQLRCTVFRLFKTTSYHVECRLVTVSGPVDCGTSRESCLAGFFNQRAREREKGNRYFGIRSTFSTKYVKNTEFY